MTSYGNDLSLARIGDLAATGRLVARGICPACAMRAIRIDNTASSSMASISYVCQHCNWNVDYLSRMSATLLRQQPGMAITQAMMAELVVAKSIARAGYMQATLIRDALIRANPVEGGQLDLRLAPGQTRSISWGLVRNVLGDEAYNRLRAAAPIREYPQLHVEASQGQAISRPPQQHFSQVSPQWGT